MVPVNERRRGERGPAFSSQNVRGGVCSTALSKTSPCPTKAPTPFSHHVAPPPHRICCTARGSGQNRGCSPGGESPPWLQRAPAAGHAFPRRGRHWAQCSEYRPGARKGHQRNVIRRQRKAHGIRSPAFFPSTHTLGDAKRMWLMSISPQLSSSHGRQPVTMMFGLGNKAQKRRGRAL